MPRSRPNIPDRNNWPNWLQRDSPTALVRFQARGGIFNSRRAPSWLMEGGWADVLASREKKNRLIPTGPVPGIRTHLPSAVGTSQETPYLAHRLYLTSISQWMAPLYLWAASSGQSSLGKSKCHLQSSRQLDTSPAPRSSHSRREKRKENAKLGQHPGQGEKSRVAVAKD